MKGRKVLALVLALALCLGLVPTVAGAAEGNVGTALPAIVDKTTTAMWTATRLDGTTINQNTYGDKTQILIFFRFLTPCSNSDNTLKGLINNAVVNNENVQIVAIGMGEHDNPPATKEALQSYMAEHGLEEKGNLVFAYSNSSNASFQYLTDYTGTSVTSLTYAVNIVLDTAEHIRAAWQGNYDAGFYAGVLEMMGLEGVEGSVQDYQLYTTAIEGKMASLDTDDIEQELTLLNEYRTAKGLGTLKRDGRLQLAAMQRAAELAVYYSHTRPNYTSCFTAIEGHDGSLMAENIAVGYPTAESVMDGWINSAGHRKNIETEAFQSVGLECFTASDGTKYWVQLFSSRGMSSGLGIGGGEEGWCENITVARGLLGLDVVPVSLEMRAGGTETVVLNNINQRFPSGISQIYATSVASTDQSVATATIEYDGTVTVTAAAAGSTTIKVGLAAVDGATAAVTVGVPVTVTGTAPTPSVSPTPSASPSVEPGQSAQPSVAPSASQEPSGEWVVTELSEYNYMSSFIGELAAVEMNGKWGFVDKSGEEVIPCKYDNVGQFFDGLAAVEMNGEWGFIDKTGREVIPCRYDDWGMFSGGFASVKLDGKKGLIDKTGQIIIPFQYDAISSFCDDLAEVKLDGKWGYIDKTGKEVVPLKYDGVYEFREGVAVVCVNVGEPDENGFYDKKYGVVDKTGKEIVSCKYDDVCYYQYPPVFSEGMIAVAVNNGEKYHNKWGFVDTTGQEVIPCQYDGAYGFKDGTAQVCLGNRYSLIDKTGKEVVSLGEYSFMWGFCDDGLAMAHNSEGYGFVDKTGKEVIPCKYEGVSAFFEDLAAVQLDGKTGFIDRAGRVVIPAQYTTAHDFRDGFAVVATGEFPDTKKGIIDKNGKTLVPCKYDYIWYLGNGYMEVELNGKRGLISITKKEPTQPTPSDSPSPSPSDTPSSSGGGSSGYRPSVVIKPVESPKPTQSQPPVEPSEVPITPASELFGDVVKGSWYEPGVTYVVIQGLFKGMDVGVFSPDTNMTRAMVMTVLARMDGQDTTNATNGPWHTNIMNWAKAKGISDGTMPDSSVTREQLVTLLYRYAKPADAAGDLTAYADGNSVSAWAERAMVWAVNQEIITGKNGGRLDPQGFATRAEVATIFQRFVEKTQPNSSAGR